MPHFFHINVKNLLKEHSSCSNVHFQNMTHSSKFLTFKTTIKELIFLKDKKIPQMKKY